MSYDLPEDDWLARKVSAPQLELIVGRLTPMAAMGLSSRRAMALLTPSGDDLPGVGKAGLIELATWDPGVAVNLLAAAAQGRSGPAESIVQALAAVGEHAVQTIALASLGRRWPAGAGGGYPWDRQEIWRHCIATALAAGMLAEVSGLSASVSQAQTWGLLHDLGKLGMLQAMPKSYARVLESLQAEGGGDLPEREQMKLGVDHSLFGRRMAQRWRLGEELANTIWLHHQPLDSPTLAGEARLRAGIVQLADATARELKIGQSGNSAYPVSCRQLAEQLGIGWDDLTAVREQLLPQCARLCEALGVGDREEASIRASARVAEASIGRLAREGEALQDQVDSLSARAKAMEHLARFAEALRPDESLPDVLAGVARLVGEALELHPSRLCPIAAYAMEAQDGLVVAARLAGGEQPACRTFRRRSPSPEASPDLAAQDSVPPDDLPAPPEAKAGSVAADSHPDAGDSPDDAAIGPSEPAMQSLLEDPAELGAWLDLDQGLHVPLVCGGRRVGGVLLCGPLAPGAAEVLAPLRGVVAMWLAMCLQGRRASALNERLAEDWGRLASAQERLAEATAFGAVGQMAAGAAHEINNPLAVISGRAQLMAERAAGEDEKKVWRLIVEQAQRISDIISSLVELAAPRTSAPASLSAAGLLSEAAGEFAGAYPQAAALKVDIETAADLPLLKADRSQIVEVLRELLDNAASAGATRVLLGARESPELGVILTVADDGAGMDGPTLAAAFTPLFSRQSAGRRRGMGLAKARRTVEAHGGRIWIHSDVGRGTTVFVQLPLAGA